MPDPSDVLSARSSLAHDTLDSSKDNSLADGSSGSDLADLNSIKAAERQAEARLIQAVQSGDRDAYRDLVDRYRRRVVALALEVTRSAEDAEDVAQETFVKAYLSLKDFKGQSSFYTWIYRIALNMAIDVRRKVARQGGKALEFDERVALGASDLKLVEEPDKTLERKQDAQVLEAALQQLSEEQRIVLTLRELDGLSYDEIADVVGISKGTVMSRLHYARKRVQAILAERGVGAEFAVQSPLAVPIDVNR
jgi:RNA polymerase sigma-70 factor (ECF subfamily)